MIALDVNQSFSPISPVSGPTPLPAGKVTKSFDLFLVVSNSQPVNLSPYRAGGWIIRHLEMKLGCRCLSVTCSVLPRPLWPDSGSAYKSNHLMYLHTYSAVSNSPPVPSPPLPLLSFSGTRPLASLFLCLLELGRVLRKIPSLTGPLTLKNDA
ncbi:hypothetical protein BJX61DRAFT_229920 [Aspergillus egyptiacus]|nr:hypothetical protein BJX61DRAFT_229920 [Aspergillus egyptiacus]